MCVIHCADNSEAGLTMTDTDRGLQNMQAITQRQERMLAEDHAHGFFFL